MNTEQLRIDFEKICKIIEWNPTDKDLINISLEFETLLKQGEQLSIGKCQGIINKYCPDALCMILDGVDNSDLNSLLTIAIKKSK